MSIVSITKKQVFANACRLGESKGTYAFVLHSYPISAEEKDSDVHVGYIVTKKIGNAVARNRIKRRLRAALQEVMPDHANTDTYYICRGKKYCAEIPFIDLKMSIMYALEKIHAKQQ
jgi:ribonuclease P protein component